MDNFDIDKRSPYYDEYYSVENILKREAKIKEYMKKKEEEEKKNET